MIELTDNLIAFLVPEDSYDFRVWDDFSRFRHNKAISNLVFKVKSWNESTYTELGDPSYKIIGTITRSGEFDFDCKDHVIWDDWSDDYELGSKGCYRDYLNFDENEDIINYDERVGEATKEESFISLLELNGISLEKLNNQKILIVQKWK
jgi:hypothetical protein